MLNSLSGYGIISILEPQLLFSFNIDPKYDIEDVMGYGSFAILGFGILVNFQEGLFAYWSCTCAHQNQIAPDIVKGKCSYLLTIYF